MCEDKILDLLVLRFQVSNSLGPSWELSFPYTKFISVLRIHFILMLLRIRILDPPEINPDPDPGLKHFFNIYFLQIVWKKNLIKNCLFLAKTWWADQRLGYFFNNLYRKQSRFDFCPLDPDPGSLFVANPTDPKHCFI